MSFSGNMDHAEANPLECAAERYRDLVETLPDEYRSLFLSCYDEHILLDEVKALESLKEGKLVKHLGRIRSFVESAQPLFAALDVLCQVDPIHFATVWGGVRVLVQLTSNFFNFYEKLTESLARMSSWLEFFKDVYDQITASGSDRLKRLLRTVFVEILDFLTGIMRIFHTSEGKAKSRGRVYAGATLRPFRFDQTIDRIKEHRQQIIAELVLLQTKNNEKIAEKLRDQSQTEHQVSSRPYRDLGSEINEELIDRIRMWLAPTSYASRYQDALELRKPRTSGWIFEHSAYQHWNTVQERPATLWIHGKAGSGKTILAAGLVENKKVALPDQSPFYFFFSSLQAATSTSAAAYSAILSQVLQKHSRNAKLLDMFRFSMYFATDGQPTASGTEVGDLLELCLQLPDLEDSILILDGLDECEDAEKSLLPRLKRLVSRTRIKTVLLGRSSVRKCLKDIPDLVDLHVGNLNLDDIQLYLQGELDAAIDQELLPESLNREDIAKRLCYRADGMFLWARLMMVYLKSPGLLMSERMEAISDVDLPEGLETMYERILKQMARAGKASLRVAGFTFTCLIHLKRDFSARELEDAMISRKRGGIDEPSRRIPNFADNVLSMCGGFVEQSWVASGDEPRLASFRFIHASVMEYLMAEPHRKEKGRSIFEDTVLIPPRLAAHASLTTLFLEYIIYALPKAVALRRQELRGKLLAEFPLSRYAATHWPDHVLATNGDEAATKLAYVQEPGAYADFISALCQLVSSPNAISAWIQTCYVFGHEPPYMDLSNWAREASQPDSPWRQWFLQLGEIIPEVKSLALYIHRVAADWGDHLVRDPCCIWEEVGAFNPSEFSVNPRGITVKKLISTRPSSDLAGEPIHKISQLMPDGEHDYVLSVFPNKDFREYGNNLDWDSSYSERLRCSTGWVARLEVFTVEDCEVVASLEIPLSPESVCLQLYQSMAPSPSGCSVQVPLSISPTGRHLTVLRTLYTIEGELTSLSYTNEDIVVQEDEQSSGFWTLPKRTIWPLDAGHLCLYWVYFDDSERYLSLVVQAHFGPLSVHVFELQSSNRPLLRFLARASRALDRSTDDYYPGRVKREFELSFHPHRPVLVIAGLLYDVYLWDFNPSRASKGFVKLDTRDVADYGKVQMLCFSADGDSCILQRRGRLPTVIDVSRQVRLGGNLSLPALRRLYAKSSHERESRAVTAPSSDQSTAASSPSALTVLSDTSGTLFAGSTALSFRGQSTGEAVLGNEGEAITLSKLTGGNKNSQSVTLTRIPRWPGSSQLQPGVVLPNNGSDDVVKIVLDRRPSTANRLSASQEPPTVVGRNIRSIQRTHQIPNEQRLLLTGEGDASRLFGEQSSLLANEEDGSRLSRSTIIGEPKSRAVDGASKRPGDNSSLTSLEQTVAFDNRETAAHGPGSASEGHQEAAGPDASRGSLEDEGSPTSTSGSVPFTTSEKKLAKKRRWWRRVFSRRAKQDG